MKIKKLLKASQDAKALFITIMNAYDNGLGIEFFPHPAISTKDEFFIEEGYTVNSYIMHTSDFVAGFECELNLLNEEEDKGQWYKTYNVTDITTRYRGNGNSVNVAEIEKFVKKHVK